MSPVLKTETVVAKNNHRGAPVRLRPGMARGRGAEAARVRRDAQAFQNPGGAALWLHLKFVCLGGIISRMDLHEEPSGPREGEE